MQLSQSRTAPSLENPKMKRETGGGYVFLLLMDVSNLKPDILLGQWSGRIRNNVLEALNCKSVVIIK